MRKIVALLAALALAASACSSGPDRAEVLDELAASLVIPAYRGLEADVDRLVDSVVDLCAEPDAPALAGARQAMVAARRAWKGAEAIWVGPVMERRSWAVIDWPIDPEQIEDLLVDPEAEFTVDYLGRRIGADQRGLGAIEYVIGGEEAVVLEGLAGDRCDYLVGVARVVLEESRLLPLDWTESWEGAAPYRELFAAPDGSGLDQVVNDVVFLLERMTDVELGGALGIMNGEANPEAIVEGPAGLGVEDMLARLAGVEAVLVGSGEPGGLRPLLGEDLGGRLAQQVEEARAAVREITPPLRSAIESDPSTVAEARQALKAIQVTVQTEVVSRLGVTIGFSDTDGDSG